MSFRGILLKKAKKLFLLIIVFILINYLYFSKKKMNEKGSLIDSDELRQPDKVCKAPDIICG